MPFITKTKVRFADVDIAGIVFYPRYFEMLNGAVEDWFAAMGLDFQAMHLKHRIGVPTVHLECDFHAPSEIGDELIIEIKPVKVGRSSCTIEYLVRMDDQVRLTATGVLVCMDLDSRRATAWPKSIIPQLNDTCAAPA